MSNISPADEVIITLLEESMRFFLQMQQWRHLKSPNLFIQDTFDKPIDQFQDTKKPNSCNYEKFLESLQNLVMEKVHLFGPLDSSKRDIILSSVCLMDFANMISSHALDTEAKNSQNKPHSTSLTTFLDWHRRSFAITLPQESADPDVIIACFCKSVLTFSRETASASMKSILGDIHSAVKPERKEVARDILTCLLDVFECFFDKNHVSTRKRVSNQVGHYQELGQCNRINSLPEELQNALQEMIDSFHKLCSQSSTQLLTRQINALKSVFQLLAQKSKDTLTDVVKQGNLDRCWWIAGFVTWCVQTENQSKHKPIYLEEVFSGYRDSYLRTSEKAPSDQITSLDTYVMEMMSFAFRSQADKFAQEDYACNITRILQGFVQSHISHEKQLPGKGKEVANISDQHGDCFLEHFHSTEAGLSNEIDYNWITYLIVSSTWLSVNIDPLSPKNTTVAEFHDKIVKNLFLATLAVEKHTAKTLSHAKYAYLLFAPTSYSEAVYSALFNALLRRNRDGDENVAEEILLIVRLFGPDSVIHHEITSKFRSFLGVYHDGWETLITKNGVCFRSHLCTFIIHILWDCLWTMNCTRLEKIISAYFLLIRQEEGPSVSGLMRVVSLLGALQRKDISRKEYTAVFHTVFGIHEEFPSSETEKKIPVHQLCHLLLTMLGLGLREDDIYPLIKEHKEFLSLCKAVLEIERMLLINSIDTQAVYTYSHSDEFSFLSSYIKDNFKTFLTEGGSKLSSSVRKVMLCGFLPSVYRENLRQRMERHLGSTLSCG